MGRFQIQKAQIAKLSQNLIKDFKSQLVRPNASERLLLMSRISENGAFDKILRSGFRVNKNNALLSELNFADCFSQDRDEQSRLTTSVLIARVILGTEAKVSDCSKFKNGARCTIHDSHYAPVSDVGNGTNFIISNGAQAIPMVCFQVELH